MQIDILLATYNGERFLAAQLESFLNQTCQNWRLLIHDDGSTDNTINILKKYSLEHPDKIFFIEDGVRCGGAKKNFSHLIELCEAEYIMFCDQDDVWLEQKVEVTFNKLKILEQQYPDKALLVHSDLKVVNENLDIISESMFDYQRLPRVIRSTKHIAVQNNITGCTVMMNRKALSVSLPIDDASIMHDWWIGIKVLQSDGIIELIPSPLILYRQHQGNSVGSKKIDIKYFLLKLQSPNHSKMINRMIFNQAKAAGIELNAVLFKCYKLIAILCRLIHI